MLKRARAVLRKLARALAVRRFGGGRRLVLAARARHKRRARLERVLLFFAVTEGAVQFRLMG